MAECKGAVAMIAGVNAGIIAGLLQDLIETKCEPVIYKHRKKWCRCSMKKAAIYYPFLTLHQIEGALKQLKDAGIIVSLNMNENRFDHTNWYAYKETKFNEAAYIDMTRKMIEMIQSK